VKQRRQDIARAVMAGEGNREIARRVGIRAETVSRIRNQPETKLLMSQLLQAHREQVIRMVGKSLTVIEDAFAAKRMSCSKRGEAIDLGTDHFARLAASKRLQELLATAREGDQQAAGATMTWEAFLAFGQCIKSMAEKAQDDESKSGR
jgi:hypothetical protein